MEKNITIKEQLAKSREALKAMEKEGLILPTRDVDSNSQDGKALNEKQILTKAQEETLLLKDAMRVFTALNAGRHRVTEDKSIVDISLAKAIEHEYGYKPNEKGLPMSFAEALGIDPNSDRRSVMNLWSTSDNGLNSNMRAFIREVFLDAVRLGSTANSTVYQQIVAGVQTISNYEVVQPYIQPTSFQARNYSEGGSLKTMTIKVGEKRATIEKFGFKVEYSEQQLLSSSLNAAAEIMQQAGTNLGQWLSALALDILVNGEANMTTPNPADVVGVLNTSNGVTYYDIMKVCMRMARLGNPVTHIVASENDAFKLSQLDEFRTIPTGAPLANLVFQNAMPANFSVLVDTTVPDGMVMLLSRTRALKMLITRPLTLTEKYNDELDIHNMYARMEAGFIKIYDDAAMVIDGAVLFTSNGFASNTDVDAFVNPGSQRYFGLRFA